MTYEGIRLKILKIKRKLFANIRKKGLRNYDFTIISNNCWGGMIYESYNLPKNSPTVGMFFFPDDYIKFVSNLKYYINYELRFINPYDSKWKDQAKIDKRFGNYPIAVLDDVEMFCLHYKSEQEVIEKWQRRCKRINYEKLLVKFNDQNGCTQKNIIDFLNVPIKNKIVFTCKKWNNILDERVIEIKQKHFYDHILASYEPFGKNKYVDITKLLNNL